MDNGLPIDPITLVIVLALFAPLVLFWAVRELHKARLRRMWAKNAEQVRERKTTRSPGTQEAASAPQSDGLQASAHRAAEGTNRAAAPADPTYVIRRH